MITRKMFVIGLKIIGHMSAMPAVVHGVNPTTITKKFVTPIIGGINLRRQSRIVLANLAVTCALANLGLLKPQIR